jgi:hypothetical protein
MSAYTVAKLPSPSANKYLLAYVTNGNNGIPCLAVSDGTAWKRILLGSTVSDKPIPPPPGRTAAFTSDYSGEFR